jgi:glycosyltransferase involved in cell wall biosynthesis
LVSFLSALYISPHLSVKEFGGSLFAATNLALLREALGTPVTAASISRTPPASAVAVPTTRDKLGTALANLQGLCATLSKPGVACLRELLVRERPTLVWLDTSLLGRLIPLIRRELPATRIVCAFQNVEANLVRQRLKAMQPHYLPAWYATWLNEKQSACGSDLTLALHTNDAEMIAARYGCPIDRILPIIVADRMVSSASGAPDRAGADPYLLFVGSAFPPNIEALRFICQHLASTLLRFRIVAVGSGLDRHATHFKHPKLEVRGFVEDLSAVYRGATAVIAPIFSGGGMKVKIAEALMHGKSVIASPFAAIGFEACSPQSIRMARTADEFATQVARLDEEHFNPQSRADYQKLFSYEAGLRQVREIVATLELQAAWEK